jgi:hypothetical protein
MRSPHDRDCRRGARIACADGGQYLLQDEGADDQEPQSEGSHGGEPLPPEVGGQATQAAQQQEDGDDHDEDRNRIDQGD